MTTEPSDSNTKESRFARDARLALHLGRQPAAIVPLLRSWLVKLWASRGGGFYGLGYVVTFVALEIRSLSGGLTTVSGLLAQAAQYVLRFSVDSVRNVVSALIWPAHLFEWLGGPAGLIALAVGYAVFEICHPPPRAGVVTRSRRSHGRARTPQAGKAREKTITACPRPLLTRANREDPDASPIRRLVPRGFSAGAACALCASATSSRSTCR